MPSRPRAGRNSRLRRKGGLRPAIAWAALGLGFVLALSLYKSAAMDGLALRAGESVGARDKLHSKVSNLFQASYYFFYDEQFLPGIQQLLREGAEKGDPRLQRVIVVSKAGATLFDSAKPSKPDESAPAPAALPEGIDPEVAAHLNDTASSAFTHGFKVDVLVPGPQFAVLYGFDGAPVRSRVLAALLAGILAALAVLGARRLLPEGSWARAAEWSRARWARFWRLRVQFLATIVLINLATAAIVFFSLVAVQTREQTERIQRDSMLFSQFSTAQVISNFTNYFYFYYSDRFIPETRRIIASNEDLVAMRIVSRRTGGVLFDSEQSAAAQPPPDSLGGADAAKADFSPEIREQLRARDLATQLVDRGGERMLSVVNTFRNESQEPVFWVEYAFGFRSLERSLRAIRRQILLDLIPSMALGLLIAIVFAQLLISPIRRLVAALRRVEGGDYDVTVDLRRTDELGDLVGAFNSMTEELRKKKELRKYLSDSTYRQVMKAPDAAGGAKLGGSRVSATVLFSDIRNFVGHCESLEAEEVTAMLNEYFSEMVEVVYKHGGEVDKFIGDALLAVFYAPDDAGGASAGGPGAGAAAGTALQAIYCAIEMRERLAELNARRAAQGKALIETGVGITHGEIISGPIGSKDRMDFTVIGDVVNLASRIEKLSKKGRHTRIMFSDQVEGRVRGLLDYDELEGERLQGKEEPVRTFELIGVRDIDALVRNLRGPDLALRRRSVELLGQSRNPAALAPVAARLDDADEQIRLQAVQALSKLAPAGDDGPFEALVDHLVGERSEKVLSALIAAVGKLATPGRHPRAIAALTPFLDAGSDRIVANAVEALGQARDPQCTDLILPKLASRSNRVKANAAIALFAAGRLEVVETLKPMLMHSDPLMRSSAAFAIGELTLLAEHEQLLERWKSQPQAFKFFLAELQECVPMLVSMLRDPDTMARRQAVLALGKIKDKSAVLPIIDMLDPVKGSGELLSDISHALRSIGSHKLVREVIARLSSPG